MHRNSYQRVLSDLNGLAGDGWNFELLPSRGVALFRCLNMPWVAENWRLLRVAPSRRQVRRLRDDLDAEAHIAWAEGLLGGMR